MLEFLPGTTFAALRASLQKQLRAHLTRRWIKEGALWEVFLALHALWKCDPAFVSGAHLATAVQRLIAAEGEAGGPYGRDGKNELLANAYIALFMRQIAQPLPNVEAFLMAAARRSGSFCAAELYALGQTNAAPILAGFIRSRQKKQVWRTPQGRVLAVLVTGGAKELGGRLPGLARAQLPSGFWAGEPWFRAAHPLSHLTTTAFIAGSLEHLVPGNNAAVTRLRKHHAAAMREAKRPFTLLANPLRASAMDLVSQIDRADKYHEITLQPRIFAHAFGQLRRLTPQQYAMLGAANVCTWVAYSVYDDFLDDEGTPAHLPMANIAMRSSLHYYRIALPKVPGFQRQVEQVFCGMDQANAWEVSCCRFTLAGGALTIPTLPVYSRCVMLAKRSFGHVLPVMAVLARLEPNPLVRRHVEAGCRHLLIARQLNDDLHDWQKDLQAGHASYVVAAILRDLGVLQGTYSLKALLPDMQAQFRKATMPRIARHILSHIYKARLAFRQCNLTSPQEIEQIISRVELPVRYSLVMHAKSLAFARAMRSRGM